jgi:hypothetical protein
VRRYPFPGTFLRTIVGPAELRVAGGAAFAIENCRVLGGCNAAVTVDAWDLRNAGVAATHLSRLPRNGTVVEGLPSGRFWRVRNGRRAHSLRVKGVVSVDDSSLRALPMA